MIEKSVYEAGRNGQEERRGLLPNRDMQSERNIGRQANRSKARDATDEAET